MEKLFEKLPKRVDYYVVIYDIFSGSECYARWNSGSEWRRAKIARILLEVGVRTQKSVFELNVSKSELKKILIKIKNIAKEEVDKIYVYPIESKVCKNIKRLGYESPLLKSIFI